MSILTNNPVPTVRDTLARMRPRNFILLKEFKSVGIGKPVSVEGQNLIRVHFNTGWQGIVQIEVSLHANSDEWIKVQEVTKGGLYHLDGLYSQIRANVEEFSGDTGITCYGKAMRGCA